MFVETAHDIVRQEISLQRKCDSNSNRIHVIPGTLGIVSVLHAIVAGASGLAQPDDNWLFL